MKTFKKYINEAKKYDKLSEEEQLELVKKDPINIKHITNPSEKVQLEAVKKYGATIYYIKNPSELVQLEAIRKDGHAIQCIKKPSAKIQLEAVKQNIDNIFNIINPDLDVVFYCIINKPELLKTNYSSTESIFSRLYRDDYFQNLPYKVQKRLIDYNTGFVLLISNLDKRLRNSLNVVRDITGLI